MRLQARCRAPRASSPSSAPASQTTSSSRPIGACSSLVAARAPVPSPPNPAPPAPRPEHAAHSTYSTWYSTYLLYLRTHSTFLLSCMCTRMHLLYHLLTHSLALLTLPTLPLYPDLTLTLTLPLPLPLSLPLPPTPGMFLHADTLRTSSWQMQIRGRKRWHLCPGPGGVQAATHWPCSSTCHTSTDHSSADHAVARAIAVLREQCMLHRMVHRHGALHGAWYIAWYIACRIT